MHKFIVTTHLGDFTTVAVSPAKAISNIRWRLYGRSDVDWNFDYWTVREAA